MRESKYIATNASQSYNFGKHKRKWFSCMNTLLKHNELPQMDRFIKDFLRSIKCPIIDPKKSDLCKPRSKYLKDFSVMTVKLSHVIGLNISINTATNNNGHRNNRRVSSAKTDGSQKRKSQDSGGGGGGSCGGEGEKQPFGKPVETNTTVHTQLVVVKAL